MNIVKLKDKIKPGDDFFNEHLKGKYAWWVHMRFIIPFDHMGINGYIACEEDLRDLFRAPYGTEFRDTYDREMWDYVDQEGTDAANVINEFKMHNQYVSNPDITVGQVKNFRTWLATEILKFDSDNKGNQLYTMFDNTQTYVLQYYANNMYDDVIKKLSSIHYSTNQTQVKSTCGCSGVSLNELYEISNTCDPVSIYRKDIYNKMVLMFSDMSFWTQLSTEFINQFKKYIDNIIINKLPISINNQYITCDPCSSDNNNVQILNNLSTALGYMVDNQTTGHKNFIYTSLNAWATKLYENMQWI